jgi:hypothetical protein
MSPDLSPLDYGPEADADRETATEARRGARTRAVLAVVWAVGLASWVVWLAALAVAVVRLLGT